MTVAIPAAVPAAVPAAPGPRLDTILQSLGSARALACRGRRHRRPHFHPGKSLPERLNPKLTAESPGPHTPGAHALLDHPARERIIGACPACAALLATGLRKTGQAALPADARRRIKCKGVRAD